MWDAIWTTSAGFVGGIVAWFFTNWVGRPITEFERTRREVRQLMIVYGNVAKGTRYEIACEASDRLRQMAARVDAAWTLSPPWVRWYFRWCRRWNLKAAQRALMGLSNSLLSGQDWAPIYRHHVEVALGFPTTRTPDQMTRLQARLERDS